MLVPPVLERTSLLTLGPTSILHLHHPVRLAPQEQEVQVLLEASTLLVGGNPPRVTSSQGIFLLVAETRHFDPGHGVTSLNNNTLSF